MYKNRFIVLMLMLIGVILMLTFKLNSNVTVNALDKRLEALHIPFTKFTLDNGLRVIVHQDHTRPLVAVQLWYHVGSKNERIGLRGAAHLFEHLAFTGSDNHKDSHFTPLEAVGGVDMNGTTYFDRTNYYQTVPTQALDLTLWLESDRMGHFIDSLNQKELDNQIGVVLNEKRQSDNKPYSQSYYTEIQALFPEGHPYHHPVIGVEKDLSNITLDNARDWFAKYYNPSNAVLVLAGDITPEQAQEKAQKYFGHIASGQKQDKVLQKWQPHQYSQHFELFDAVPQRKMIISWVVPGFGTPESVYLDLVARVLGGSKYSRLHRILVEEKEYATSVIVHNSSLEIAGIFSIEVLLKDEVDIAEVERIIKQQIDELRYREHLPYNEVALAKSRYIQDLEVNLEKLGGGHGIGAWLARYELYNNSPKSHHDTLQWIKKAHAKHLTSAVKSFLSRGPVYVTVKPQIDRQEQTVSQVSRSKAPEVNNIDIAYPKIERFNLDKGIPMFYAKVCCSPRVAVSFDFAAGYSSDSATQAGLARLSLEMLKEGTINSNASQLAKRLDHLGSSFDIDISLDTSRLILTSNIANLKQSLEILEETIRQPRLPEDGFARLKKKLLASIKKEQANPIKLAFRLLPSRIYSPGHKYAIPFTGSGYIKTVEKIELQDVKDYQKIWFVPANLSIHIAGNLPDNQALSILNQVLHLWKLEKPIEPSTANKEFDISAYSSKIYIIDRPDSKQSLILGGYLTHPSWHKDAAIFDMGVKILGGNFTSRINMNIREEKGWAYGAYNFTRQAVLERPVFYYAPVQVDKTAAALKEIQTEAVSILNKHPITNKELAKAKKNIINSMVGRYQRPSDVLQDMSVLTTLGRSLDYWPKYIGKVRSLKKEQLHNIMRSWVDNKHTQWVIVGDVKKILPSLKKARFKQPIEIISVE